MMPLSTRRWLRPIALALASIGALLAIPAHAEAGSPDRCRALRAIDFSATRDAAFMVTSTTTVATGGPAPYCRVEG